MMKHHYLLFRMFALVVALACALGAHAYDFYKDGIYYIFSDDYDGVEVYEGPNDGYYSGIVNIPSTVQYGGKTYNVVGIAGGAFFDCTGLTSVTIPNTVKIIRTEAFSWCTGLTRVTIPASVQYIGFYAFYGCTNLISVTSMRTTPPQFYDMDDTTEDLDPFSDVTYTRATLYVPEGCKSAYQKTGYWKYWYRFSNIKEMSWDFSVDGFCYNYSLEYENGFGSENGVVLSDYAGGNNVSSVVIPSTVQYGGKTYDVIGIGECAFSEFPQMTSVTIPKSIVWIGLDAFYACTNLSSVRCLATTPPTLASTTFITSQYSSVMLFVPKRVLAAYQAANYWKKFTQMHPTLDYALNTDGGTIEFSSTGYYPWTNVVEDGRVYAVSGNKGAQSRSSTMTTTVTLPSDGRVTFAYKAWGEGSSNDKCIFSVDGTQKFSYGNKQNNWVNYSAQLPAGTHTLTWTYSKNSSVNPEGDYFAVDNVVITVNTIPGDADGDGVVTVGDVTAIIDMILSGVTSGTPGADVDGNGTVNIADVTALIDYILTGN